MLRCLGSQTAADGSEYQLLLEFVPGVSLADEAERNRGNLEKGTVLDPPRSLTAESSFGEEDIGR
jgi:hypothetical protein